jgi:large subunit ribosomal protein L24
MKKEFSKKWKGSKQPRKKRKYQAKAPLHIKRKLLNANLSKELRKKYGKRSLVLRKGDIVKIMRGKFKNKQGKIINVDYKRTKIIIEGINITKKDGSKAPLKIYPSKVQIIELNLEDKKRIKEKNNKEIKK